MRNRRSVTQRLRAVLHLGMVRHFGIVPERELRSLHAGLMGGKSGRDRRAIQRRAEARPGPAGTMLERGRDAVALMSGHTSEYVPGHLHSDREVPAAVGH